jgi:NAD(P)-dependent dehydrogenase (short-subunit alcohol dehydrogenase family)
MSRDRFEGQVAVVTGAAKGIGLAIAHRLAEEGARVWLLDQDERALQTAREELSRASAGVFSVAGDITSEASVADAFARICAEGGPPSIVINSAGIVGPNAIKASDVPAEEFDRTYRVNLLGSFLITKHALRAMLPQDYGRILLIASIAGKEGNAGMCAYSATKAGVIGLVKAVGKEYATTGITINGLAPAVIRTSMVDNMDPTQVKYMTDKIPMQRCGTLDEIAAMACWIVSREASFTTGFTYDLSGGRAVY